MVLIGTGGISWSDVDEQTTPNLWLLLRDGSSAALSVRSVYSNTCPIDGWLGVSAGSRAAAPRTGPEANPADRPCPAAPVVSNNSVLQWPSYLEAAEQERFDTRLGLLGDTAAAGTLCVKAVQPYAAAGGARRNGTIEQYGDWSDQQMLEDLNGCPVTLVDVGSLRDPDDVAGGEPVEGTRRAAAHRDRHPHRRGHRGRTATAPTTSSRRCRMPAAASGCASSSPAGRTSGPGCSSRSRPSSGAWRRPRT